MIREGEEYEKTCIESKIDTGAWVFLLLEKDIESEDEKDHSQAGPKEGWMKHGVMVDGYGNPADPFIPPDIHGNFQADLIGAPDNIEVVGESVYGASVYRDNSIPYMNSGIR